MIASDGERLTENPVLLEHDGEGSCSRRQYCDLFQVRTRRAFVEEEAISKGSPTAICIFSPSQHVLRGSRRSYRDPSGWVEWLLWIIDDAGRYVRWYGLRLTVHVAACNNPSEHQLDGLRLKTSCSYLTRPKSIQ